MFRRFLIPAVRLDTAQGPIVNLDGQGVRFEWSIERDNTNKVDRGTVSIFNLDPKIRGAIHEAWRILSEASGYLVTFSLGWARIPVRSLVGDVFDLDPDRRTPTDVITTFQIGDGTRRLGTRAWSRASKTYLWTSSSNGWSSSRPRQRTPEAGVSV